MIAAGLIVVALVATLICILSRGRLVVRLRREYLKEWRLLGARWEEVPAVSQIAGTVTLANRLKIF